MKQCNSNICVLVCVVIFVSCFTPLLSEANTSLLMRNGKSLLNNPGFENGAQSWSSDSEVVTSSDTRSGSKALVLMGKSGSYVNVSQTVKIKGGHTYRFSGWLKVTGLSVGKYEFRTSWYDKNNIEIRQGKYAFGATRKNRNYIKRSALVRAPIQAVTVKFYLQGSKANGSGIFDDMDVRDIAIKKDVGANKAEAKTIIAKQDQFVTSENKLINLDLIKNDVGFTDKVRISLKSNPVNGQVKMRDDGQVVYQPNVGYFGTDSFVYQLSDAAGNVSVANVLIDIQCLVACKKEFLLNWNASKSRNVIGYKVYVGRSRGEFNQKFAVEGGTSFKYLASIKGEYYFSVVAITNKKTESDFSETVSAVY